MPDVTAPTRPMWAALKALAPHTSRAEDDVLQRIHLEFNGADLVLTASNRTTAIAAAVEVIESATGEAATLTIHRDDVAQWCTMFRPDKDAPDAEQLLRIEWTTDQVTVTDASGLLDGRSATWPCATGDDFPDLAGLIGSRIPDLRSAPPAPAALAVSPAAVELFAKSAKFASSPLRIFHVPSTSPGRADSWLLHTPEWLGLLVLRTDVTPDDDDHPADQVSARWSDALPTIHRTTREDA